MRAFRQPGAPKPQGPPGSAPGSAKGFTRGERRKLAGMGVGLVLLLFAFLYGMTRDGQNAEDRARLPESGGGVREAVVLPEIDAERIGALVSDASPTDRVVLENDGLDAMLAHARALTPRHFEAMETTTLDAAGVETLLASPDAHRAEPFLVRGSVDALRTRRRTANGEVETIGRLTLEDGASVYFLVLDAPETVVDTGGWLRVDGLFLKVYSDEDQLEPGTWIEGPLIVGPRAQRSYRAFGDVTEPHWGLLSEVRDANLSPQDGSEPVVVRETPFEPLWHLMAYARDLPEGAVDWASVPELDRELMSRLESEPEVWRGQPLRIPISRIQDARVKVAGENPARIERYTEGWIGHADWPNVVHFKSPILGYDLEISDYAFGHGFFLHDFAYDAANRSLRSVPLLVLTSLEAFEPRDDPLWGQLATIFVAFTAALGVLLAILLFRDRRRSRELQAQLVRRRQERRRRRQPVGTSTP